MKKLTLDDARLRWAAAQGLTSRREAPLDEVVAATGWIRTLGGAEAYLALAARCTNVDVERVRVEVAEGRLQVLPAARGCIYLVPRRDAAIALRLARSLSESRNRRDLDKAGVLEGELDAVADAALDALAASPLSTRQLGKKLPTGVVRKLGELGKKVGISSTLPPALRQLEFEGKIVRRVVDDRLDHERYVWTIPPKNPLEGSEALDEPGALHQEVARRFFTWAGPATRKELAAWAGIGLREADAAIASLGLVEVEVETVGAALALPQTLEEPPQRGERVALVPALDNLYGLRSSMAPLVPDVLAKVEVSVFGAPPRGPLGEATLPLDRTLVHEGRVVGLWAYDPERGAPPHHCIEELSPTQRATLDADLEGARRIFEALGHGKSFSLDKDDKLVARARRVAALSQR